MDTFLSLYNSSVGKKFVVALTGLFICSFLVVHLTINLFLFKNDGGQTYDLYAHFMSTNIFIRPIEYILALGFLLHIFTSAYLWWLNKQARSVPYKAKASSENSTLASRTMFVTGSIVFIFLVVHIRTFFVPTRFADVEPSSYEMVKFAFRDPLYVLFYVIAISLLGYHLRHGFQSAFQTFGIKDKKYAPYIHFIGGIFWLLIPLLYIAMPVYFYFNPY
ncbi:MAG: succinate dehydrogenase cytochrome b subunit [Bacteroidetes bacterium]|nr:MAG: succinate dehydrogenase cytochrome b subunit [Bacteroidota bacterium]